ncbi:MAG: response regulator, partial [Myxococcota bacterium]
MSTYGQFDGVSPGDTIEEGGDTDVLSAEFIETGARSFGEEPSTVTGQDSLVQPDMLDEDVRESSGVPSWVPEARGKTFEDALEHGDDSWVDQEKLRGIFRDLEEREVLPRVLIVDDEPYVLRAIRRLLRPMEVEVLAASNGAQAIEMLEQAPVSVLISDQFMPGMSGTELLEHAQQRSPETVRVMLTGNNDLATAVEAINRGDVFRFVNKPWKNEELVRIVELGLEQHRYVVGHRMYQQLLTKQNDHLSLINDEL